MVITGGVVLFLLGTLLFVNKGFYNGGNLSNLLRQIAPVLLLGVGQGVVMLTGNIDLSIGSVTGMSCMIAASLMADHAVHPAVAVLVALGGCLVVGLANGMLVGKLRIPSFVATLGTMAICRGIAQLRGYNTPAIDGPEGTSKALGEMFRNVFYYGKTLGIFNLVWIVLAVWVMVAIVVSATRPLYAIGRNAGVARRAGIPVAATITGTYMLSALCAGLVGIVSTAAVGMGIMDAGTRYVLYALAAAVLGGISIFGGRGSLWGAALGAAFWAVLQNGLALVHAKLPLRNIAVGIVVLVAVLVDILLNGNWQNKASSHAAVPVADGDEAERA